MSIDIEEQYDKIYRYCYFKLHNRELAEDVTQETFLRYYERYNCVTAVSMLKCLYTIARNICVDEYRKPQMECLEESMQEVSTEEEMVTSLAVGAALSKLDKEERELLLLRYVNEVPIAVIGKILGISRFSVYRKLQAASNKFRNELRKEDLHE